MEKNEKANSYLLKLHHVLKAPPTGFLQVQTYDSFFITESLRKGPSLNAIWIHSSLCSLDERVTRKKKERKEIIKAFTLRYHYLKGKKYTCP